MHELSRLTVDLLINFNPNMNSSFNQLAFLGQKYIRTSINCFVLGLNAPASG